MAELLQVLAQLTQYSRDIYLTMNLKMMNQIMMIQFAMMMMIALT